MSATRGKPALIGIAVVFFLTLLGAASALAVPSLQLDISDGYYDWATETTFSSGDIFTLYAFLVPDQFNSLWDTYYISAALVPQLDAGDSLGHFLFDGENVIVTADMTYGNPPLNDMLTQLWDSGDLQTHGIYEPGTYFAEFPFLFSETDLVAAYDAQYGTPGSGYMYYRAFSVDLTGLDPGYGLHFDLYNTELLEIVRRGEVTYDLDIVQSGFAPFSHDAQTNGRVPEPGWLTLLAMGFGGAVLLIAEGSRRRD